ncbi:MAG: purine phosphorylase, partial [Parasphingorhabdus sp.]
PHARIATADCFVKCPDRSGYLRDALKADLVDMETAAVAQIATLLDIPWAGIKAVTDGANSESSGDFHANLERAANRAAREAARFIELL